MIRLISIFLTVCILAGTKCNTPQNSATQHDEQREKWTRIEANSAEIRAQITSIFSTAHCMDSLLDSVKVAKKRAPVRRTYLESPNPNPQD